MQSPTLCHLLWNSLNRSHFKLNMKWNLLRQIQKVYGWASCKFGSSFHWEGFVHRFAFQPIWDMSSLHSGSLLLLLLLLVASNNADSWPQPFYTKLKILLLSIHAIDYLISTTVCTMRMVVAMVMLRFGIRMQWANVLVVLSNLNIGFVSTICFFRGIVMTLFRTSLATWATGEIATIRFSF